MLPLLFNGRYERIKPILFGMFLRKRVCPLIIEVNRIQKMHHIVAVHCKLRRDQPLCLPADPSAHGLPRLLICEIRLVSFRKILLLRCVQKRVL